MPISFSQNPMRSDSSDLASRAYQTEGSGPEGSEGTDGETDPTSNGVADEQADDVFPCLVQYIVFPPHVATYCMDRLGR